MLNSIQHLLNQRLQSHFDDKHSIVVERQAAVLSGAIMYAVAAIYGTRFKNLSASMVAACTMLWVGMLMSLMGIAASNLMGPKKSKVPASAGLKD